MSRAMRSGDGGAGLLVGAGALAPIFTILHFAYGVRLGDMTLEQLEKIQQSIDVMDQKLTDLTKKFKLLEAGQEWIESEQYFSVL